MKAFEVAARVARHKRENFIVVVGHSSIIIGQRSTRDLLLLDVVVGNEKWAEPKRFREWRQRTRSRTSRKWVAMCVDGTEARAVC